MKKIVVSDSIESIAREDLTTLVSNQILVVDNVLDSDFCRELIVKFLAEHNRRKVNVASDHGIISFDELNVMQTEGWKKERNVLLDYLDYASDLYKKSMKVPDYAWPKQPQYEQIRMKHYRPNLYDRFDPHVDVGNHDTARRFLVMFWYLNDVLVGGETEFYLHNLKVTVKPKAGRLICFPPMWTHPHAGLKPVSNEKFLVGSYLHYA